MHYYEEIRELCTVTIRSQCKLLEPKCSGRRGCHATRTRFHSDLKTTAVRLFDAKHSLIVDYSLLNRKQEVYLSRGPTKDHDGGMLIFTFCSDEEGNKKNRNNKLRLCLFATKVENCDFNNAVTHMLSSRGRGFRSKHIDMTYLCV